MDFLQKYLQQGKDRTPIPLYEVMGNKIFVEKFDGEDYKVYRYCLDHNKTWQEVLEFKYNENVKY